MVFARNVAMGFNRWADRRIDAENPPHGPTREIPPQGRVSDTAPHCGSSSSTPRCFIAVAASINSPDGGTLTRRRSS